jgi:uncharacterized membrane protein
MQSRLRILGHPLHPMLIVFPIATFSVAVVFDIIYLANGDGMFARFALWLIAVGVVTGLLAALFGLIDWLGLPSGSRAKRIGLIHGVGNVVIVGLFIVSWILRLGDPEYAPSILPFVLGVAGVALALVTAWLGGELVYRLRVGVDDGANLNATNSLSESGLISTDPGDSRVGGGQATTGAASR